MRPADPARRGWPDAEVLALAEAFRSTRQALHVFGLLLAEQADWLPAGRCAGLAQEAWTEVVACSLTLSERTCGALPPWPIEHRPPAAGIKLAARILAGPAADPLALSGIAEVLLASPLSPPRRRGTGIYYTPPELAAAVVEVALAQGSIGRDQRPTVLDPCVGGGAFVAAAARALAPRMGRKAAALSCCGAELSASAIAAARAALVLEAGPDATQEELRPWMRRGSPLRRADSLFDDLGPPVDLLLSNPPYGHLDDAGERARIALRYPALRGGEVDRYAAFLLRSLELVREGGTAALLVPDTWMTNARTGALRAAILEAAELAAVVDLGKPFSSAKDTRVQAVVLVRRRRPRARATFAARATLGALEPLAFLERGDLLRSAGAGWQPYRSQGERDLCAAMKASSVPLGELCSVGYGLRTGDNKRHVVRTLSAGAVPLLGGEDLVPFAIRWRPKWLRRASLDQLGALVGKQLGRPRVAIQRIRTNSRQPWARWLEAAICPPDTACLDSLSTLACDDDDLLWALLGLAGSVALDRCHRLRTTDVNVKPSALRELPAPVRLRDDRAARRQLAALARARADEAAREPAVQGRVRRVAAAVPDLERRIDGAVYALYGLPDHLIDVAERGFWGDRYEAERRRLPDIP